MITRGSMPTFADCTWCGAKLGECGPDCPVEIGEHNVDYPLKPLDRPDQPGLWIQMPDSPDVRFSAFMQLFSVSPHGLIHRCGSWRDEGSYVCQLKDDNSCWYGPIAFEDPEKSQE